jgi:hypothetical protein
VNRQQRKSGDFRYAASEVVSLPITLPRVAVAEVARRPILLPIQRSGKKTRVAQGFLPTRFAFDKRAPAWFRLRQP